MKTGFCIVVLVSAFLITAQGRQSQTHIPPVKMKLERDQMLFLEAAKAIANGKYPEGRILLNTMVWTYGDSALIDQAKLLMFYSRAREGGPRNEERVRLLHEIQKIIEEDQLKTEERFKPPQ